MHHFRFTQRKLAVALGILAVAYTVQAYRIPEFTAVETPVQPGSLPRVLGLVLFVLSVALFFQKPKAKEESGPVPKPKPEPVSVSELVSKPEPPGGGPVGQQSAPPIGRFSDTRLELAALLAAIGLYAALFVPLGFVLSTALFVSGLAWHLGYRRHAVNALVGAGTALGLYFVMSEGLEVALPMGLLPF
ncbi:tripartite tricarboxylate transporter TctB family protein [Streptomyces apocyni]|uniref:tripartite tricarboxylate transporter TctB family protein n=1 Tax=Streptomyces apocyni TaxID=2654677 RepID=UPI0012E9DC25|nr:tripartite tricarboxylate transporter TctB family protein [Streptomyces apocyni]